jgi:hypothetical protein
MLYANDPDGIKIPAAPSAVGSCPGCADSLIPKCGEILIWHWSHRSRRDSDCDSWYEPETDWHRWWKARFPREQVEVTIGPHRADAVAQSCSGLSTSTVLEFQHSNIAPAEIREREAFYTEQVGNMLWVVDAAPFKGHVDLLFSTHYEPSFDAEQRAALATIRAFLDPTAHVIDVIPHVASDGWTTFKWRYMRRHHLEFKSPLYWDLGNGELLRILKLDDIGSGEAQLLSRAEFLTWYGGRMPQYGGG